MRLPIMLTTLLSVACLTAPGWAESTKVDTIRATVAGGRYYTGYEATSMPQRIVFRGFRGLPKPVDERVKNLLRADHSDVHELTRVTDRNDKTVGYELRTQYRPTYSGPRKSRVRVLDEHGTVLRLEAHTYTPANN